MADELVRDFPLFPLGIVALPHEYVPLHIFEERYRTMIGEVLESDSEFGIIWQADDETKPVGCACIVTEVLERMDDGRMNIVTRGTRPFRLLVASRTTSRTRPGRSSSSTTRGGARLRRRRVRPRRLRRARRAGDRQHLAAEELGAMDAYAMAATVDFGLDAKQGLLDLRSENARLRLVLRLFRAATKRLDFIERAQARARSNGKVRFG